ncbi:transcriptional regulator [Brevibacillus laterosporus]|nr:transcriptional regulator [Brevibacillus laterosporus]RAP26376.1 hypothetical protein C2W64_01919 [Brevibacillus laterosporus]TPG85652.1 transcriptional regulator [Brevibacillus laterosporus]
MDVLASLRVVDIDQICFHEAHEEARLLHTCQLIQDEGVLRHTPLASQLSDGRYLILDGAHRTLALKKLQCSRAVVQMVHLDNCHLGAWNHLLPVGEWMSQLKNHAALYWSKESENQYGAPLAEFIEHDGNTSFVYSKAGDEKLTRLKDWHSIVDSYNNSFPVKRLPQDNGLQLPLLGEVLLRFPCYSLQQLEEIALAGHIMPAGVTRCMVEGRLLNLRIPLEFLTSQVFRQDEWNELLSRWKKSLRLYSEAVYLCEV